MHAQLRHLRVAFTARIELSARRLRTEVIYAGSAALIPIPPDLTIRWWGQVRPPARPERKSPGFRQMPGPEVSCNSTGYPSVHVGSVLHCPVASYPCDYEEATTEERSDHQTTDRADRSLNRRL